MKALGVVFASILGLVVIIGLSWVFMENDTQLQRHYAPQQEQIRRETYEQSKSYNSGMVQELQNMQFEYLKADADHKQALASIILHRAADYGEDNLPSDLRQFVRDLKNQKVFGSDPKPESK